MSSTLSPLWYLKKYFTFCRAGVGRLSLDISGGRRPDSLYEGTMRAAKPQPESPFLHKGRNWGQTLLSKALKQIRIGLCFDSTSQTQFWGGNWRCRRTNQGLDGGDQLSPAPVEAEMWWLFHGLHFFVYLLPGDKG